MFIAAPDVVHVLVVAVSLVTVPDAVRFVTPLLLLLCIATLAASVIPVLLKLMTDVFDMCVSSIELDFNVSVFELYKYPFTARSFETVRDGVAIEPLLEIERDDAFMSAVRMFGATTDPVEFKYEPVIVPKAFILQSIKRC